LGLSFLGGHADTASQVIAARADVAVFTCFFSDLRHHARSSNPVQVD
jgi:hypothetical protein